ncbi:MAG: RNA 2'-phosphotransferase [Ktedonobacteraceae bacterium]|nr:RNA 2'-phosphotransferase [Ktedonobacteraceae bacterium]
MKEQLVTLSRTIAYALRHHPEQFGLTIDDEGWVPLDELLTALRQQRSLQTITIDDIVTLLAQPGKKRFEMYEGMIRAYYGHSIAQKVIREPVAPPTILFHGTTPEAAQAIKVEGLKPMQRQYVHLSADEATARTVALRKTRRPVILHINAQQAHEQGLHFYYGNDTTWLADTIPPRFIQEI